MKTFGAYAFGNQSAVTVYGYKDTPAESYCAEQSIRFIPLEYPIVDPVTEPVYRGEELQLHAIVYTDIGKTADDVLWSLDGTYHDGTSITPEGLLTIAPEEESDSITALATYGKNSVPVAVNPETRYQTVRFIGDYEDQVQVAYRGGLEKPALQADGYHFTYALVKGETSEELDDSMWPLTVDEDLVINVTKSELTYRITYHADGAENPDANRTEYSVSAPVVFSDAVKEPYQFAGWFTADGQKIESTEGCYQNLDLYARWNDPMHEHEWDEGTVTKEATCTEEGSITYTCPGCGDTQTEIIPAKGHTEEILPGKEPTCMEPGLTEGKICTVCGETLVEQTEIPAGEHKWDEGTVTKEATCTMAGERTHTCEECDQLWVEEISPTGIHSWDAGKITKKPTTSAAGVKTYTCKVCKTTKTEAVPKLKVNTLTIRTSSKTLAFATKARTFDIGATKAVGAVTYTPDAAAKKGKITVSKAGKVTVPKNCPVGTYRITVKAAGNSTYAAGTKKVTVKINKATNPLTIRVASRTYAYAKLKKTQVFIIGTSKAQGKVTYTLNAPAKKVKITVKNGKVTVPKKCRKGTYKITVKAAGNKNYKAGTKIVTIRVK